MSSSSITTVQTRQKAGWVLVFGVALLQTISAGFLLLFSGPATFESDTGVSWAELSGAFPTVADQFSGAQQASLVATLALGLVSLSVTYFALRDGQRWAWFTMWLLPASMIPGMVSLAQSESQVGVAVFAGGLILVAVVGLVLSYGQIRPSS
jgi:hypothetical protein